MRQQAKRLSAILSSAVAVLIGLSAMAYSQDVHQATPTTQSLGAAASHVASQAPSNPLSPDFPSSPALISLGVILGLCIVELVYIVNLLTRNKALQNELQAEQAKHVQLTKQMEFQALYDGLTQLPNRRLFRDRLLHTIKTATRHKSSFGVMMADLDRFKAVNDTMGHDAGDLLLQEVANRLRSVLRDSDTVARLGGDEFAFICPSIQDMSSASVLCMRILQVMQQPVIVKGKELSVGISLGIALFPTHAQDEDMLLRRADTALYRAKQKRSTFVMYDSQVDRAVKE